MDESIILLYVKMLWDLFSHMIQEHFINPTRFYMLFIDISAVFMVFKSETALTITFINYLFFCFTHRFFSGTFWNLDHFLLLSLTIISAFYYNDSNEENLHHRFYLFYCTNTLFVHVW